MPDKELAEEHDYHYAKTMEVLSSSLSGKTIAFVTVEEGYDNLFMLHFMDGSTFVLKYDWLYSWILTQEPFDKKGHYPWAKED